MKSLILSAVLITIALLFCTPSRAQQAGKFDYYVLNMSWSPEYCHSHQGSEECSKHLGLIVHGLWPQYDGQNGGPENCGDQPGPSDPNSLLDILPTISLIQHEWTTHGTCSGLGADNYFALMRKIFTGFHVPPQLDHPTRQFIIRAATLKQDIEQANPDLNDSELALTCTGQYLKEVELCVTKDGIPQPCSGLRQCTAPSLRVPPVQ